MGLDHRLHHVVIDFHEAEATGAARLAVVDQSHRVHVAVLAEQLRDLVVGRREGQVALCLSTLPSENDHYPMRRVTTYS